MWSVQHFIVWGRFERTGCSQQTWLSACVCVRVSQQQTMSIKERNCSIILATATNQLVHLCPSQLLERTWTNSASTRGTGCLFVHCISPTEWIDPFTPTDKGMKGNKTCILYSLIHLSCPFMQFTRAISEGNSNTLALTMYYRADTTEKPSSECCLKCLLDHYVTMTEVLHLIRIGHSPEQRAQQSPPSILSYRTQQWLPVFYQCFRKSGSMLSPSKDF